MKRFLRNLLTASTLSIFLMFTGCINLKPKPDTTKHYLLGGDAIASTSDKATETLIYVARPSLPEYLKSNHLLYTDALGTMLQMSGTRWGESVESGIARALAEYLSSEEGMRSSGFYPWVQPKESGALKTQFHRIDAKADGTLYLYVDWKLVLPDGTVRSGSYRDSGTRWLAGDAASYVEAINSSLSKLAEEVVASSL